jgi:hypothetical protein
MPRLTDTFLAEPGLEHADRATHQSGDPRPRYEKLVELRGIEPLTLRLPEGRKRKK